RERLDQADLGAAHGASHDTRLAILSPGVETPNVGEVVDDPPADVVARAFVLLARIAKPNDDFHRLLVPCRLLALSKSSEQEPEHEADYFLASSSSSGFGLRMSSGSAGAAASAPSTAATTGASSTFGAVQTQTVAPASSRMVAPSGSLRSLTCRLWPIV